MALGIIQRAKSLGSNPQNQLENPKGVFVINRILLIEAKVKIKITITSYLYIRP